MLWGGGCDVKREGLQYHFFKILDFGHVFLMKIANNILASFLIR